MNTRRRSFTIAAGAELNSTDAEGVLFAHGGCADGHALYLKDGKLHCFYSWFGERHQKVKSDAEITAGEHLFVAEIAKTGEDEATGSAQVVRTFRTRRRATSAAATRVDPFGAAGG